MRILPSVLTLMLAAAPLAAQAQAPRTQVVLELYTSQGCGSCPPADALLAELAREEGVIALALHVDYWDYLGWKDAFGQKAFSKRQKGYARLMRQRTLFTPQMVIQGQDVLIGHDGATIRERIAAHRAKPSKVDLKITRDDETVSVKLAPLGPGIGPADVQVVEFVPDEEVMIEGGENAGKTVTYTNIATNWTNVGRWDGASDTELTVDGVGAGPIAVIVQRASLGPIVSAAKLP